MAEPELKLEVVKRIDRQDGEVPAYLMRTSCCGIEVQYDAWVIVSAWRFGTGHIYRACQCTSAARPMLAPKPTAPSWTLQDGR